MNGEKIVEIVEKTFADEKDSRQAIKELEELKNNEGNIVSSAIRLIKAYENQAYVDFCGHLRQTILNFGYPIRVSNRFFFKFAFNNMDDFGLNVLGEKSNLKFSANPVILPEEQGISNIYKYEKRNVEKLSFGDGRLYKFTKYRTYRSFAQKILMNRITKMEFGDTLLACLPTGAGKSLSWQLPGVSNEYNGLIIVIVPTVALAINHEKSSRDLFDNSNDSTVYPKAYYADCGATKKEQIKQEIMAGVLPILYISPEALMQRDFKEMMIEAAKIGKISMLVVDEAHLIVDWGGKFRPEFQLIPSFRNSINQTGNKIKTVLLSATITDNDTSIIKTIFEDDNNFIEYRADSLRPEITYKLTYCEDKTHRIQILKKLVKQAPKPIIVYASLVEYAQNIYDAIIECGFKNVRLFTGKTSTKDRQKIMSEWDLDNVDIIVATSAFGMGVDKNDIRTIIHTFIPENVSRFYQESGRAGRDGYSALDYCLLVNKEDKDNARELVKSNLATTDTIVTRWFAMKNNAKVEDGDCLWVDTHTTPNHLLKKITGEQNADWNKGVILFLYRNHFIDILDVSLKNGKDYLIKVKILKRNALERKLIMQQSIEQFREDERKHIDYEIEKSFELFRAKYCFADIFRNEYPYVKETCNGCPYCEKIGKQPYFSKGNINIVSKNNIENIKDDEAREFIIYNKESLILCEGYDNVKLGDTIAFLIKLGIHNFIIPRLTNKDFDSIYDKIKFFSNIKDLVLIDKYEFENYKIDELLLGPIAIILDNDDNLNKTLFKFANKYENKKLNNILFISKQDVIDPRYNKIITETEKFALGRLENLIGGK